MFETDLTALFAKAGFTRWPLLICSIVGMTIIFERSIFYFRLRANYKDFGRELFLLLNENKIMQAIHFCERQHSAIAHIAGVYLKNYKNKKRDAVLSREGTLTMEKIEGRLRGLTAIIHIAPLLGLLGTVAGLVVAFHEIELATGAIEAKHLAGGIWEALISTVFGLIVAIPCIVSYYYFESITDKTHRRIQSIIHELDEFFGNKKDV